MVNGCQQYRVLRDQFARPDPFRFGQVQAQPAAPCNCIGPQNGQPRCPCQMRNVQIKNGRYVIPEQDLGPTKDTTP